MSNRKPTSKPTTTTQTRALTPSRFSDSTDQLTPTCNYTMDQRAIAWRDGGKLDHSECNHLPEITSAPYIGDVHPDTDEHRAGCTHCQYVHDSKLPDLRLEGELSPQECATVLHGLRMIQCEGRLEGCNAGDCEHFEDHEALTNEQIDALAERINLGWINRTVDRMSAPQAQESKTWTPPSVVCGECDASADSVLELAKHWKASGHTTARVHTNSGPRRRKEDQPGTARTYFTKADECVRLCEALAAFWGDGVCDAPIWPGAYLTEEDTPIRDLIRAAVGWRKPLPGETDMERDLRAGKRG